MHVQLDDAHLPVAVRLYLTHRNFEKAAGAIAADDFFDGTSWTSDLLTVFAIHQMIQGVERIIGTRSSRIEGPLLFLAVCFMLEMFVDRYGDISARATDEGIWERHLLRDCGGNGNALSFSVRLQGVALSFIRTTVSELPSIRSSTATNLIVACCLQYLDSKSDNSAGQPQKPAIDLTKSTKPIAHVTSAKDVHGNMYGELLESSDLAPNMSVQVVDQWGSVKRPEDDANSGLLASTWDSASTISSYQWQPSERTEVLRLARASEALYRPYIGTGELLQHGRRRIGRLICHGPNRDNPRLIDAETEKRFDYCRGLKDSEDSLCAGWHLYHQIAWRVCQLLSHISPASFPAYSS